MKRLRSFFFVGLVIFLVGLGYRIGYAQEETPVRKVEEVIEIIEGDPKASYMPGIAAEEVPAPAYDELSILPPSWSRLAFETFRDDNWEIYVINPDNTNEVRVTNHPATDIYPALSHGGDQLLFSSERTGNQEIYLSQADGTNLAQLTNNGATNLAPVFSRDKSKIVFRSSLSENPDVFVMNADGSSMTQLTFSAGFDGMPDWSPDGQQIVFVSNRTGIYTLWVMNADGSNQHPLNLSFEAIYPKWSPVDDRIAFSGDGDGDGFFEVWVVNADGSAPQELVNVLGGIDVWLPTWSPDGNWLAYTKTYWYLYQGYYYWTSSYLYALSLSETTTSLPMVPNDGNIWRASWVSTDVIAPTTCEVFAPSPARWRSFLIEFSAQDVGEAGVARYEAEYRLDKNSAWHPLGTVTYPSTLFQGPQRGLVDFRCRAHDQAGNIGPWQATPSASTLIDTFRPVSQAMTETPIVLNTQATISWSGQDVEGGEVSFDVFVKDGEGDWTLWLEGVTYLFEVFTGEPGHTYYFRSQARDEAGHLESWQPTPDTSVSFYSTHIFGAVTDARGHLLAQPLFQASPQVGKVFVDPATGYQIYFSEEGIHALVVQAEGFAPLFSTEIETNGEPTFDWVLTSETNHLINGDFETGVLTGWEASGPGVHPQATALHSGQYGVNFSQNITTTSQITQAVLIPVDEHAPTLSFLYQLPQNLAQGHFEVFVQGTTTLPVLSTTTSTEGWRHAWADLSAFSGETITLVLRLSGIGLVNVDEISIGPWETPLIKAVTQAEIPGWEATSLVVLGQNFMDSPTVYLNDTQLTEVVWDSPTQITALVPEGLPRGGYDLTVINPNDATDILPEAILITWHEVFLPIATHTSDATSTRQLGGADWPTLGQNNAHTGYHPLERGASRYSLAWATQLPYNVYSLVNNLAVADGLVVVADHSIGESGGMIALDANSGKILWQYNLADPFSINPATIAHGTVFFQKCNHMGDTFLYALDLYSGEKIWQSPFPAQWNKYLPPVVTDAAVFINGGQHGGAYAFEVGSGKQLWAVGMAQETWGPTYSNGRLFAFVKSLLRELDPLTGASLWSLNVDYQYGGIAYTTAVISGNTALLTNNVGLFAVDIDSQQLKWQTSGNFINTLPATDGNLIYVLKEGALDVYSLSYGAFLGSFEGDGELTNAPVLTKQYVYVASFDNTYVLDRTTLNVVWQTDVGGWLTVSNGFLYISSFDRNIYAYRAQEP